MSKKKGGRILLVVMLAVIAVLIAGYGAKQLVSRRNAAQDSSVVAAEKGKKSRGDEKQEAEPVPVEVTTADFREISSYYRTTATLEPERKVDVVAKTAGEVAGILVEEGVHVKRGDLLLSLDDSEERIALEEAEINEKKERRELARFKKMYEENLISDKEYSDAEYKYEVARNNYDAAKLKYGYTKVRAPFEGVVTKRFVDVGAHVSVGMKLFELADIDPLLVCMYLPENEIAGIKPGQTIYINPDSDPGRTLTGRIARISPEVDDKTGTVKVTAEVSGDAMPGSFVRIKIVTATHPRSLAVPRKGLVSDTGEFFVFVAESDTVRKTPVQIGFQDEGFAEVLDGLEPGDSVVVVGQGALKHGSRIKVIPARIEESVSKSGSS